MIHKDLALGKILGRLRVPFTANDKHQIQVAREFLRIENKQINAVQNNS